MVFAKPLRTTRSTRWTDFSEGDGGSPTAQEDQAAKPQIAYHSTEKSLLRLLHRLPESGFVATLLWGVSVLAAFYRERFTEPWL